MADFSWSNLGDTVGKYAPLLGTLIAGPAGATVGSMIASALGTDSTPAAVLTGLQTNPEAAIKLRQIESDERVRLQELATQQAKAELEASTRSAESVNKTMQAESASEHWPTYTWRPFIGFVFGANMLISTLTVAILYISVMRGNVEAAAALSTLPAMIGALGAVNGAALPVIGVASWFRGKMQADPTIPTINRG